MREVPISNSEKEFIIQAVKYQPRLDGRTNDEYRKIKINFGADWGSVLVAIGETKVLAQVSCELTMPKAVRPNEGMLFVNVEMGMMAAPHLVTRNAELHVQINRTLERTFKDSKAVDLESLCVLAEEHVWMLRVDLNVLNHDGNVIDCCAMAALCALAHFRRPDITIEDKDIIIHTAAEKELLPTVLHHYPVCVSFATFNDGQIAVVDPTVSEERTGESHMIFGINQYRELCCLNLGGSSLTSSKLILQCASRAAYQAKKNVEQIKEALAADIAARESGVNVGFTECLKSNKLTGLAEERFALRVPKFNLAEAAGRVVPMEQDNDAELTTEETEQKVLTLGTQSVLLNSKQMNIKWVPDEDDDDNDDENVESMGTNILVDSEESESEEKVFDQVSKELNKVNNTSVQTISDSEEEEQVIL